MTNQKRRKHALHAGVAKRVGEWAERELAVLGPADRLASTNDLRMARSYVEKLREIRRFASRYARALRTTHTRLTELMKATPDVASPLVARIREENWFDRLQELASEFESSTPKARPWRSARSPAYVVAFRRQRRDGVEVATMDAPMPPRQAEALEVQRHGHRVFKRLVAAGLPPARAEALTRAGLREAGLVADRRVDFTWKSVIVDVNGKSVHIKNQPTWLYDVAQPGSPRRGPASIPREIENWRVLVDRELAASRRAGWDPTLSQLMDRISGRLEKRRGCVLEPHERKRILRSLNRNPSASRSLCRTLASFSTGLSRRQVVRRDTIQS